MRQMASANTSIQTVIPDEYRGRVMSLYAMTVVGLGPFGSLGAGALAGRFGARATVAAGGVLAVAAAAFLAHSYAPPPSDDLREQVSQLTSEVQRLQQEQAMPAMVLNRYRNSICYIFGVYRVGFANEQPALRVRVSGTGFVVGTGLLATNRHVAEPWYEDS